MPAVRVALDFLAGGGLRLIDADDFGERGQVERRSAVLSVAGRGQAHQVACVVGHGQAVRDPLEDVQADDFTAAVDDLAHPGLGHPDRPGDP